MHEIVETWVIGRVGSACQFEALLKAILQVEGQLKVIVFKGEGEGQVGVQVVVVEEVGVEFVLVVHAEEEKHHAG